MKYGSLVLALILTFSFGCRPAVYTLEQGQLRLPIPDEPEEPTPDSAELLSATAPEITRALREFEKSSRAPVIKKAGFLQYPYGESEPVMYCQPLRACDIELEAGEEVLGIALGDRVRWEVTTIFSGTAKALIPHLIIKPRDFDIATNLIISTSKRTYHIGLISSEKNYVRRVKFYYPNELLQFRASKQQLLKSRKRQEIASLPNLTAEKINFDYEILGGKKLSWRPVRAFDDGTRVYIQMAKLMAVTEAPALLVKTGSSTGQLVNYRVKNNYYVVDRLFSEALLVAGVGREQDRVIIRKK